MPGAGAARLAAEKKKLTASERDEAARADWAAAAAGRDPAAFVFVDETSASIALTRRYARASRTDEEKGALHQP